MKPTLPGTWRCNFVYGLLMLAVPALCVHVATMMRDRREQALRLAEIQQRTTIPIPARTGTIFARTRNGYVPLAISRQLPGCYADPHLLEDADLAPTAKAVAAVLEETPATVQAAMRERRDARFVVLKRDLTEQQARAVQALDRSAIRVQYEWRRFYPSSSLASQVIGFRLSDGRAGDGLELSLDRHLTAEPGQQAAIKDAGGRAIWPIPSESKPPRDGNHVFLCLDAVIQEELEQAVAAAVEKYEAHWGVGVVVDPRSGEVLAMCSAPTFDANAYSTASAENRTNRAIVLPYEPGSAFKPIMAAAAVEAGVVSWQTKIDTGNGTYNAPRGGSISDHGHAYGVLTVAEGIIQSSNILMAKVGEMLGNAQQYEILKQFGIGAPTGLELPGECPGIVRELKKWDGYSLRRVPFGQEVSVTVLQLAMGFCPLVNGGVLLRPRLVDSITDAEGRVIWRSRPEAVRRVLSAGNANQTLAVLQDVVERGTGKACRLDRWTSFGKTGTAQVPVDGKYNDQDYMASFVGGGPVGEPRVLCVISIYRPNRHIGYYGGTVAAPYVRQVLEKVFEYLDVPPDIPPDARGKRGVVAGTRGW